MRDRGTDSLMGSEEGVVEVQTYKKMDWKELGEHPLSTLTRIFGQEYLMSEIGARPDQETFIELDQIHNFSHLMIEYALMNRIVGPLDKVGDHASTNPLPSELVMDIQKPPGRLKKILGNLGANQPTIDYEETTLASLIARNSSSLIPYEIQQDHLERILKQSSPVEEIGKSRTDLPPTLVEQVVKEIYLARHSRGTRVDIDINIDTAISTSWALINQRIGGLLAPTQETLRKDAEAHRSAIVAGYIDAHQGYADKLKLEAQLREQRKSEREEAEERRKLELQELEKAKLEGEIAYENAIKVRSGVLFPDMPESDRRTSLYKKCLLATQALILTNFVLKNDLGYGNEMIAAYERSVNPKPIELIGEEAEKKIEPPVLEEPLEPAVEAVRRSKVLEELLISQVASRDTRSTQLLQEFVNAASIEFATLTDKIEPSDDTENIERTINARLTIEKMRGDELSKLEEAAQEFLLI